MIVGGGFLTLLVVALVVLMVVGRVRPQDALVVFVVALVLVWLAGGLG